MLYSGDEFYADDITSGPYDDYGDVVDEHYVRPADWVGHPQDDDERRQ